MRTPEVTMGGLGIKGDSVPVDCDSHLVKNVLCVHPGELRLT
jgi:hypothetical protein